MDLVCPFDPTIGSFLSPTTHRHELPTNAERYELGHRTEPASIPGAGAVGYMGFFCVIALRATVRSSDCFGVYEYRYTVCR